MTPGSDDRIARIVLLGLGHTNVEIVRRWRAQPIRGVSLSCVSNESCATYSGMLPGVLAGQYTSDDMSIDLARLCSVAGTQLVVGDVIRVDRGARTLHLADGRVVSFDLLSVGIGSVPSFANVEVDRAAGLVAIKPMQTFLARLADAVRAAVDSRRDARPRIVVVGAGAGGVEVGLTLPTYLRDRLAVGASPDLTLVSSAALTPGRLARTNRRVERALLRRGVRVVAGHKVVRVAPTGVTLADGRMFEADVIVWATEASAPPLLARFDLPRDPRGFLLTGPTLQTVGDPAIFAVGDSGSIVGTTTPRAGVYAVRQGPILWENIGHAVAGTPLRTYRPQPGFLTLLNTGDGRAVGEWRRFSFEGAWCWRLKDAIDRRFMRRYQEPASSAPGR